MLGSMCLGVVVVASILPFEGSETAPQPVQRSDIAADVRGIDALRDKFAAYNSRASATRRLSEGMRDMSNSCVKDATQRLAQY